MEILLESKNKKLFSRILDEGTVGANGNKKPHIDSLNIFDEEENFKANRVSLNQGKIDERKAWHKELEDLLYSAKKKLIESYSVKNVDEDSEEIDEIKKKIDEIKKKISKNEKILLKKKEELYSKILSYNNTKEIYKSSNNIKFKNELTLSTFSDKKFDDIVKNKIDEIIKILPKKLRSSYFTDSKEFLEFVKKSIEYSKFINFLFDNKNYIESLKNQNKNINIFEFYLSILNNRIIDYFNTYNKLYQQIKTIQSVTPFSQSNSQNFAPSFQDNFDNLLSSSFKDNSNNFVLRNYSSNLSGEQNLSTPKNQIINQSSLLDKQYSI